MSPAPLASHYARRGRPLPQPSVTDHPAPPSRIPVDQAEASVPDAGGASESLAPRRDGHPAPPGEKNRLMRGVVVR